MRESPLDREAVVSLGQFHHNCIAAIETAAAKLSIDPAVAAERWAHGEIATLVDAASLAVGELRYPVHAPTYAAHDELTDALKPFAKEG